MKELLKQQKAAKQKAAKQLRSEAAKKLSLTTVNCHPELVSGSNGKQMLKQVQHDKKVNNFSTVQPFNLSTARKAAFTLAEVLITLAIIGIVAALTLPTLIMKYEKKATSVALRKANGQFIDSIFNLATMEQGGFSSWEFPTDYSTEKLKIFVDKYFVPYYKVVKVCEKACRSEYSPKNMQGKTIVRDDIYLVQVELADGTFLLFITGQAKNGNGNPAVSIYIDTNGYKKPNLVGRDIFRLPIFASNITSVGYMGGGYSRDQILDESSTNNCNKKVGNGERCTRLIQLDGWEIKEDYPW